MNGRTFTLFVFLALLSTASCAAVNYSEVLGQTIITSAGSSGGTFIMSVGVSVKSMKTVEVKFLSSSISWSGADISAIEANEKVINPISVMINCKDKTYTPDAYAKDGYSEREYRAGSAYKWGNYDKGEIISGSNDGPSLTKYFKTVCAYSAQF
jgi:hypothetical protein